jgi:phenylacetate-CoA ligase
LTFGTLYAHKKSVRATQSYGSAPLSVDFRIRDFAYPASILRLRRFFEQSQWMPLGELRQFQEQRLRTTIRQAYFHVPYYRQLFDERGLKPRDIRRIEDLSKLPLLSKEGVRENRDALVADNARRFRPAVICTSGTTGQPLRFLIDKPSNILEFVYYWRHWSWAGYRLGDRFAQLRYDFFVNRPGMTHRVWHVQPHLRRLLLNSLQLSRGRIAEFAAALRRYKPKFLHSLPTHLQMLSQFLRETGLNNIQLQAVFTGGEKLKPEQRSIIEETFGCKVLDSYGQMERSVAVSQCPHGGYHINLEYGILDLADKQKTRDGTVLGRVVSTSLHRMAMPFLRYEVEDTLEAYQLDKRCPCGRTLPLVKDIRGRKRQGIITPDGREVAWMFVPFQHIEGVRSYQFIQEETHRVILRIVKDEAYVAQNERVLKFWLRKLGGGGIRFEIEYVSEEKLERDSSGRPQQVVCRLEPRSHL